MRKEKGAVKSSQELDKTIRKKNKLGSIKKTTIALKNAKKQQKILKQKALDNVEREKTWKQNNFPLATLSGLHGDDVENNDIRLGDLIQAKENANEIESFQMTPATTRLLEERGITSLFDIQAATFRMLRNDRKDIIGRARTGSGKTLAFVLPIVESLSTEELHKKTRSDSKPIVLCLAPTCELANQVHRDFEWIASVHNLSTACFTDGTLKGPQEEALRHGLDVLVGTPGRVIDLMDEGHLSFSGVRYIVLDEADEMLSMGLQEDVEKILSACSTKEIKQTLLFSATIPRWVTDLARKYMRADATVIVDMVSDSKNRTKNNIKHLMISCPPDERGGTIADVIKVHTGAFGKTIIFTQTKIEANKVANMEKIVIGLGGAGVLHEDIPRDQRNLTLAAYRDGKIRVLVATDVAARGLDIKAVDLVLQTRPPSSYETYIHRSGRTGRAGKNGTCVTFYSGNEKFMIGLIEQKAGIKMQRITPPQAIDIVQASVEDAAKKMSSVHTDNLELFREVAQKVLDFYKGTEDAALTALASSLACMAGYTEERFRSRSILSCHQGYVAVVMSAIHPFSAPNQAWSSLRSCLGPDVAAECRDVQICKDRCKAVFDIPEKHMSTVQDAAKQKMNEAVALEIPSTYLPELDVGKFDMNDSVGSFYKQRGGLRGEKNNDNGQRRFSRGLRGDTKGSGGLRGDKTNDTGQRFSQRSSWRHQRFRWPERR